MEFWGDDRAQPVIVGAILLFAILILAFAGYQATVIPNQNAQVEYSHSQQVESDFVGLRSTVINAVGNDNDRSTTIDLGTEYPARLVALNPPPATGRLETAHRGEVEIDVDTDDVTVEDVCGSDDGTTTSQSLVYTPGYNEYRSSGAVVYENTLLTREFEEGTLHGNQRLVRTDGETTRIDLLLLTGDISTSGTTAYGVDINATHRYSYGETIVPNETFTITLPSRYDWTDWNDEILESEDVVVNVTDAGDNRIEISFVEDGTYQLTCAVAGLDSDPAFRPPSSG